MLEIPALADLRRACGQRLRDDQQTGRVRTDIDTDLVGNGVVAILLSLLMSIVQVGDHSALPYADAVDAVFRAAIEPPGADTGP